MGGFYLHACLCNMGMLGAHVGQMRALHSLELELQWVVSPCVGTGLSCKYSQSS